MSAANDKPLTLVERVFLRVWCYPAPDAPSEPRDRYDATNIPAMEQNPLGRFRRVFGDRFDRAIADKVVLDIGCGPGAQVIGSVQAGSRLGVGVDKTAISIRVAKAHAEAAGVADRVRFTTDPVSSFGRDWADIVVSQNSFEHFEDPGAILAEAYAALKPGGQFFVTFGPTWWHPYGVHHMFMIRLPWAHLFFSERTILRVRQLFRPNQPTSWREVSLNRITVARFLDLVKASGFELDAFALEPIGPLPRWLVKLPMFREWTTTDTSALLRKPV
jgi:SAM-dependent methyltransferase